MLLLACLALPLAACGPFGEPKTDPKVELPYPPADIQTCFRGAANIPNRALSVGEVEALWKQDRVRSVAQAKCGARFLAWYSQLQANWK
mgnify:CR=1 FL=1